MVLRPYCVLTMLLNLPRRHLHRPLLRVRTPGRHSRQDPAIDNPEPVHGFQSKWDFQITYVRIDVLGVYYLSYPLLSMCNQLIKFNQHVPWSDPDLRSAL